MIIRIDPTTQHEEQEGVHYSEWQELHAIQICVDLEDDGIDEEEAGHIQMLIAEAIARKRDWVVYDADDGQGTINIAPKGQEGWGTSTEKETTMTKHLITDADWPQISAEIGVTSMPIGKVFRIGIDVFVHRDRVAEYVVNDPELQRHAQTILYGDWQNMADHLFWVAESDPSDVSEWAFQVEVEARERNHCHGRPCPGCSRV